MLSRHAKSRGTASREGQGCGWEVEEGDQKSCHFLGPQHHSVGTAATRGSCCFGGAVSKSIANLLVVEDVRGGVHSCVPGGRKGRRRI